ncbi:uncharacterized protein LOC119454134 [Dermacentor silvarum]|uniref:uncharacterized protein LOC119454134 n=1 Tax=Dermacentor silvarum TaxID=543639 RepID=UPI00189B1BB6|nr:uncharacterized protein LOC119454134 [Dermacentor silvarum]
MPDTMFGFRKQLSMQYVLIQIKEEVMKQTTRHSSRAILALDLKGAYDNVSHVSILTNLQSTGCAERAYNYVRGFLTDRKARIRVGEEVSPFIELGTRGTPQGSVISSLLLNKALLNLPKELEAIQGLWHALYADNVSLWTTKAGSHGWMQDALQTAAEVVDKYAKECGLRCSPQKSEQVVVRERAPKRLKEDIRVVLDEENILPGTSVRILGLVIQANNKAEASLLRHLIDPMTSKSETNRSMARTLNNYDGDIEKLLGDLENKYTKTENSKDRPGPYRGLPNEELDKHFTSPKLRIAIAVSNQKSAGGRTPSCTDY